MGAEHRNRLGLAIESAEQTNNPETEHAEKDHENHQPSEDRNEREDHVDRPAADAEDQEPQHLAKVEGDERRAAIAAHDQRDDKTDDGQVGHDAYGLVVSRRGFSGRGRSWRRRRYCIHIRITWIYAGWLGRTRLTLVGTSTQRQWYTGWRRRFVSEGIIRFEEIPLQNFSLIASTFGGIKTWIAMTPKQLKKLLPR